MTNLDCVTQFLSERNSIIPGTAQTNISWLTPAA